MICMYTIRVSSDRRKNIIICNVTHQTPTKDYQLQRAAALSSVRSAVPWKACEGFPEGQLQIVRYNSFKS